MTTATLFIRPAVCDDKPLKVRFPDAPTRFLDPKGEAVAPNRYWLRRIADGSVVKAVPAKPTTPAKSAAPVKSTKETDK